MGVLERPVRIDSEELRVPVIQKRLWYVAIRCVTDDYFLGILRFEDKGAVLTARSSLWEEGHVVETTLGGTVEVLVGWIGRVCERHCDAKM